MGSFISPCSAIVKGRAILPFIETVYKMFGLASFLNKSILPSGEKLGESARSMPVIGTDSLPRVARIYYVHVEFRSCRGE